MPSKKIVFDCRRVLEHYCLDDVKVLRQACQIYRRDFMEIGTIDVFLEAVTIACACSKVLRKNSSNPKPLNSFQREVRV
jgi:uncharacterized membrane protein YesL